MTFPLINLWSSVNFNMESSSSLLIRLRGSLQMSWEGRQVHSARYDPDRWASIQKSTLWFLSFFFPPKLAVADRSDALMFNGPIGFEQACPCGRYRLFSGESCIKCSVYRRLMSRTCFFFYLKTTTRNSTYKEARPPVCPPTLPPQPYGQCSFGNRSAVRIGVNNTCPLFTCERLDSFNGKKKTILCRKGEKSCGFYSRLI